jgi:UDP-N-acetylglucosamine 2-epimerase
MTLLTIVGARPQFIKLAPVSRALRQSGIREIIVHTGQHYDHGMSAIFFDELGIPEPDFNLGVGSGNHGHQTGEMLKKIEDVLLAEKPEWVVVYGDTNSTLAGALAASKLHVPVAHVEAGLRSFNRRMPEEINRVLTDHVSTLLFCPTETAVRNLAAEGITQGVHLVGDVMLDALLDSTERARERSTIFDRLGLVEKKYLLATVHRAENTDDPARLRGIMTALTQLADREPVVFPVHPRTRKALEKLGFDTTPPSPREMASSPISPGPSTVHRPPSSVLRPPTSEIGLFFIAPLGYLDLVRLSASARVILTDSGGLQKEACWLGVPCVTLRDETEWVETVEKGWNILAGATPGRIVESVRQFIPPGQNFCRSQPNRSASVEIVRLLTGIRTGQVPGAVEGVSLVKDACKSYAIGLNSAASEAG